MNYNTACGACGHTWKMPFYQLVCRLKKIMTTIGETITPAAECQPEPEIKASPDSGHHVTQGIILPCPRK